MVVKGEAEDSYQTGFAIITRKGLGLDHVENTSDKDKPVSDKQQAALDKKFDKDGDLGENTVAFESGDALNPTGWANIDLITGGEKNKGLLRKLSLAVKNLRYLYKLIGSADISKIGNGTVTGAISGLNSNLGSTNNRLDNIGTVGIGYMNAYGDKSHHVGLTFETYADRSIPAIVIDGTLFHIVPNNASETKRGKIGDMYVDFESSPWRLVIVFCVDGSQYKQYVTLADL